MNQVVLIGRLTKDPETSVSQSNTMVSRFTLAVDRDYKRDGEQTADFIRIITFGKTAELVDAYLFKGRQVAVHGRIQTGSYTNKDGQKVYTTDIIADRVQFLGGKQSQDEAPAEPYEEQRKPQSTEQTEFDGFQACDDDIPF
jgi:single-strand DNA-binding protein